MHFKQNAFWLLGLSHIWRNIQDNGRYKVLSSIFQYSRQRQTCSSNAHKQIYLFLINILLPLFSFISVPLPNFCTLGAIWLEVWLIKQPYPGALNTQHNLKEHFSSIVKVHANIPRVRHSILRTHYVNTNPADAMATCVNYPRDINIIWEMIVYIVGVLECRVSFQ